MMGWVFLLLLLQAAAAPAPTPEEPADLPSTAFRTDQQSVARCLSRHEGSPAASARLRCHVAFGGRLTDCAPVDAMPLRRRDLQTLQCIAGSNRLISADGTSTQGSTVRSTFLFAVSN